MDGRIKLAFTKQAGRTRLKDLCQQEPLRLLFPRVSGDDMPAAVIATISCGLVGADLGIKERDARKMRGSKPTVFTNLKSGDGVEDVASFIMEAQSSKADG